MIFVLSCNLECCNLQVSLMFRNAEWWKPQKAPELCGSWPRGATTKQETWVCEGCIKQSGQHLIVTQSPCQQITLAKQRNHFCQVGCVPSNKNVVSQNKWVPAFFSVKSPLKAVFSQQNIGREPEMKPTPKISQAVVPVLLYCFWLIKQRYGQTNGLTHIHSVIGGWNEWRFHPFWMSLRNEQWEWPWTGKNHGPGFKKTTRIFRKQRGQQKWKTTN